MHRTAQSRAREMTAMSMLGLASLVAAQDGPIINYGSSSQYTYRLNLLPDIDQRRVGLPGNGSMYCVPTSILNLCAYAGNHGFEDDVLCDNYWALYYQLDLFFDDVTFLDFSMGFAMATDPDDGTTGGNGLAGANWAMGDGFLVFRYGLGNGNIPGFDTAANIALNGGLVAICAGWYETTFATSRDGGHCMTVAKLARSGDDRVLGVHDPASDESPNVLDSQSPSTREDYAISRELRFIGGVPMFVDRIVGLGNGNKHAIIDSVYAFIPMHAYHWDGKSGLVEPQGPPNWTIGSGPITLDDPGALLDVINDPGHGNLYMLQDVGGGLAQVIMVNPFTHDQMIVLEDIDIIDLDYARSGRVYTLGDDNHLGCYQILDEGLVLEAELDIDPDAPMDQILMDNASDVVLGLSGVGSRVFAWDDDLQGSPEIYDVGVDLPGTPIMALDPTDGTIWVTSSGSEHIVGIERRDNSLEFIEHPSIENITSLTVTPEGNLLFGDGSTTTCLTRGGQVVRDCRWASRAAGGHVFFPRSMTNHDPATMEGPQWRQVEPDRHNPGIPVCHADFAEPLDVLDIFDIIAFLGAFERESPAADFAAPFGVHDIFDIIAYLDIFSGGC